MLVVFDPCTIEGSCCCSASMCLVHGLSVVSLCDSGEFALAVTGSGT